MNLCHIPILLILAALIGCGNGEQKNAKTPSGGGANDSIVLEMPGMDSLTVLDILKTTHDVAYSTSAMGAFVQRIDSVPNIQTHFWVYSINGVMASEACDKRLTKTGDLIRWHFRRFGG
ncbi:MAG: DUF4430 domain-containing protein [bacterium]